MKTVFVTGKDKTRTVPVNVLSCPFCNGDPELIKPGRFEWQFFVACEACGAKGPPAARVLKAIEFWNHRGEPDELGTVWG